MKRTIIAAVGCILLLLVAQVARNRGLAQVTVRPGDIAQQVIARARVEPAEGRFVVTQSQAVTRIVSVAVREGDVVTKGQLLAKVELQATPKSLRPGLPSAVPHNKAANDDATGAGATTSITAARAGTILELTMLRDGAYPPGTPLATIANLDNLQLQIEVEAGQAQRVAVGQQLALFVPGTTTALLSTQLTRLGKQLAPRRIGMHDARVRAEGTVRTAYATLTAAQSKNLLLGQELEARITLPTAPVASLLPRSAVTISEGRATVFIPGMLYATATTVTLGISDETGVEVRGLEANAAVLRDANH